MDKKPDKQFKRRDLLRIVATVGVAGAALAAQAGPCDAGTNIQKDRGKRRAQYQGNSPEIQTFYRVNRYPKG